MANSSAKKPKPPQHHESKDEKSEKNARKNEPETEETIAQVQTAYTKLDTLDQLYQTLDKKYEESNTIMAGIRTHIRDISHSLRKRNREIESTRVSIDEAEEELNKMMQDLQKFRIEIDARVDQDDDLTRNYNAMEKRTQIIMRIGQEQPALAIIMCFITYNAWKLFRWISWFIELFRKSPQSNF